jgi:hypothetical protein
MNEWLVEAEAGLSMDNGVRLMSDAGIAESYA